LASRLDSAGAVEFEQVEGEKELATFPIGETYLELLESDKPDTGTSRWIAQHGERLFHICLEVEDIDSAMAELRAKGIGFEQEKPMIGHGNCRIVFLDPKTTGNLVIDMNWSNCRRTCTGRATARSALPSRLAVMCSIINSFPNT